MANVTATGSFANITVTSTPSNITVTDNDSLTSVNVTQVASNVTVSQTNRVVNVAPLATVANSIIRDALTAGIGIDYSDLDGVINVDSTVLRETSTYNASGTYTFNSSSNVNLQGNTALTQYHETVTSVGNLGATPVFDLSTGPIFKGTANANITNISFTNVTKGSSATIIVTQDNIGGWQMNTAAFANTWQFVNNETAFEETPNAQSIINVVYDGDIYQGSLLRTDTPVNTITFNGVTVTLGSSGTLDSDDIAEGVTNLYFTSENANAAIKANVNGGYGITVNADNSIETTNADVRGLFSAGTGISYDSGTGIISATEVGDIESVIAGAGLTGGGTSGNVTLDAVGGYGITVNADDIEVTNSEIQAQANVAFGNNTTDNLTEGSTNLYYTTDKANSAIVTYFGDAANGPFSINGNLDVAGNLNYVNVEDLLVNDQSITLNYGNVAQDAFIYVDRTGAGGNNAHIKWNETSDQWEINDGTTTYVIPRTTSDLSEGTNLYFTTARANSAIDAYVTSITANVDSVNGLTGVVSLDTDDIPEGSANLYYTDSRFDTRFATKTTDDLTQGSTNLYYADSLVDAHLSGGYGITYTGGVIEVTNTEIQAQANVAFGNNTTDNLTQGTTNLYFANSLVDNWLTSKTTDNLTEGATNLYYTTARANAAIDDYLVGGVGINYSAGTIDLANTTVTAGVYGDGANVPQITVDAQGRITAATNVAISLAGSGTVTSVTAGDGMTQTGNANLDPVLNVVGGYGITANADDIEFANTVLTTLTSNVTTTANIEGGYIIAGNDAGGNGYFLGDINGAIQQEVRNETGVTLTKGQAVYLTGVATGDTPHVALANSENAAHMPAIGIVKNNIANASVGEIVTNGQMNFTGHGFTVGAQLFINGAGLLSETIPVGEANLVQKIGKVVTSSQIIVQGAGRTNATPNLNNGNIFLGNTANRAVTATLDTSIVPENGNLYFTTARANTAIDDYISGGYGITYTSGVIETTNSEIQAQANVAIGNNSNIVLTDTTQNITGQKTFTSDTGAMLLNDTALALDANISNRDRIEIQGAYGGGASGYQGPDINIKKARGSLTGLQRARHGDLVFNFFSRATNANNAYQIGAIFGSNFSQRNIIKPVSPGTAQDWSFGSTSIGSPTLKLYGGTARETRFVEQAVGEKELVSQGTLRVGNSDYPITSNIANSVFTIGRQDSTANITMPIANDNNGLGDNWATGTFANTYYSFGYFVNAAANNDSIVLPINIDYRDYIAIPDGTAVTLNNFQGELANLNGSVRYVKMLSDYINGPFNLASFYPTGLLEYYELYDTADLATANVSLYSDFGITPSASIGNTITSDVHGSAEYSAVPNRGSGTTARDYTFTLPASTNDMVLTTNGSDVATFYANTDVEFHGNLIGVGTGTVTSVDSGNGLTGGPVTTSGTLAVGAGYGITVTADAVEVTNAEIQAQANIAIGNNTTDNLTEGSTNEYYTVAKANTAIDDRLVDYTGNMTNVGEFSASNVTLQKFQETVATTATSTGNVFLNVDTLGSIFLLTTTGDCTLVPTNVQAGTSYTVIITYGGAHTCTVSGNWKFAGGDSAFSNTSGKIDVLSVVNNGSHNYASLTKDYS